MWHIALRRRVGARVLEFMFPTNTYHLETTFESALVA
jgi:hypothetical protein